MAKGTKLVRFTKTMAGPDGTAGAGQVRRVSADEAKALEAADAAVVVTEDGELETATVEPEEDAAERTGKAPAKKSGKKGK